MNYNEQQKNKRNTKSSQETIKINHDSVCNIQAKDIKINNCLSGIQNIVCYGS